MCPPVVQAGHATSGSPLGRPESLLHSELDDDYDPFYDEVANSIYP